MASSSNSQTVSSSISSSCSTSQCEYDVFLSFRGEDTRNTFTDHLYHALDGRGISVFRDTEELRQGQPISSNLLKAIETSRVAVVVLSPNYASSTWCLEELAKIVGRWEAKMMTVFPIFYHVDPSDVRHQKGTFADAFVSHDERFKENMEQVQRWRTALRKVAGLAGRHLVDRPESEFIREVVENIDNHLNDITTVGTSAYEKDLIGIEARYQEALLWMNVESDDVRFIGITGISGIGKTTLAEVVFRRIRRKFEASSFIDARKHAGNLRQKLLCDLHVITSKACTERWAMDRILDKLGTKKVLIILDDVDTSRLDQLATECECFGPGSKIIIIAEDKNLLLKKCKKENIHEVKRLNPIDALQLFRSSALRQTHSEKDLEDVCREFVRYADGHPLALKVLGSYLLGKETGLWESVLEELRKDSNDDIQKALEISCKGLGAPQKELFLDIACFFNGEDKDRVMDILVDSHPIREHHLQDLIEKSLITIIGGRLRMHNLLQEMGRQIVKKGDHTRLWLWGDFQSTLNTNQGAQSIKGIMLNSPTAQDNPLNAEMHMHNSLQETNQQIEMDSNEEIMLPLNAKAFSTMINLKLLKICNVQLPQGLSHLSNALRMMEWHRYPLPSLPRTFQPRELVELIMHGSRIKELHEGFKLNKLKLLDLRDSENLVKTPNFNELPNLKELTFQGCRRLAEVHPSIGSHRTLILLNMKDCKCLKGLPCEINMESLKTFILSGCSSLSAFPNIGPSMTTLLNLYLDETAIEQLPLSMERLSGLTCLDLRNCKNLSSFPDVIWSLASLKTLNLSGFRVQQPKSIIATALLLCTSCLFAVQHPEPQPNTLLPASLPELSSLEFLNLRDCNLEDGALPDDLKCFSSLRFLNLSGNRFTRLPDSISQLSKLEMLWLVGCSRLQSLPHLPLSIKVVEVHGCESLENYSNQLVVWTSGDAGFTFINGRLADNEEYKVSELCLLDVHFQSLWQELPLLDVHFKSLWQRYMEKNFDQGKTSYGFYPQNEIPEWLHEKKEGSSVTFELPYGLYKNSTWTGMALYTVFEVSPDEGSEYYHEFTFHLDIDVDNPLVFTVPKDKLGHGSFGLWVYIPHTRFRDHSDERRCISPSFRTNGPDVDIKQCRARILYKKDMVEFVQSISSDDPDDLRQRHRKLRAYRTMYPKCPVVEEEPSASSGQRDSNARLKGKLTSLLSLLYQRDIAQNHWFDYIFPQKGIPRWFSHQFVSSGIIMPLPPNLHNDARWMGFAVCVSYTVHKQPAVSHQDSTIYVMFGSASDPGGAPLESYMETLPSRDIPMEPQRLVIYYIPRVLFELNPITEVRVLFQSDNPAVEIETCGIDLVYEHEIGAFVQTLVQCMLECPDEYRQFAHQNLLEQITRNVPPETKLLPSIENVAEDCTSPAASPNQVIPEELSRNRSPSSRSLLIPLQNEHRSPNSEKIIASWFERALLDNYKCGTIYDICFPESEIPKWFSHQSDHHHHSVEIPLPPNLYDDPNWMGFALCAFFSFHKHPTAVQRNLESPLRHPLVCLINTDSGNAFPLHAYAVDEDEVLISLRRRAFIWVLFIPPKALQHHRSPINSAMFSFVSDSRDVSVQKCGGCLVFRDNMEAFQHTLVQIANSGVKYSKDILGSSKEVAINDNSYLDQPTKAWHRQGQLEFCPSSIYTNCFPPSKTTQDWFGQWSHGPSVTIDIPPNLYSDLNWLGLTMYVSLSRNGDQQAFRDTLVSETNHFLRLFPMNACLDDLILGCKTNQSEMRWLNNLGRFIWIYYVPAELVTKLFLGSFIEVSFASDRPDVMVENCALCFLYEHNQCEFEQKLKHCSTLISIYEEYEHRRMAGLEPHISSKGLPLEFARPKGHHNKKDLWDFDGCSRFDFCLNPRETLDCFNQLSNGPSVKIDVPTNLHDDSGLMGLLLCAQFSILEHQTAILEKPNSNISHQLLCFLKSNVDGTDPAVHFHDTTKEEIRWFWTPDGFIWVSYIPRVLFPDWLSQCSCLEASFVSDWPGMMVKKCGYKFFHMQNKEKLELIVYRCVLAYKTQHVIYQPMAYFDGKIGTKTSGSSDVGLQNEITRRSYDRGESKGTKNQYIPRHQPEFCPSLIYGNWFPPSRATQDWFSQWSHGPSVTIDIPPNLYSDPNWQGLAMYVSFSQNGDQQAFRDTLVSKNEHFLYSFIDSAGLDDLLLGCKTNRSEIRWLDNLGQFIWIYYLPAEVIRNPCLGSHIEVSFVSDRPGVMVENCALCLLYEHNQREFKQKLKHCNTLISVYEEYERHRVAGLRPHVSSNGLPLEFAAPEGHHNKKGLLDFDGCSRFDFCLNPRETLDCFTQLSNGPSVTIDVPTNLYDDSDLMGLLLCAQFSNLEHQTAILEMPNLNISHQLLCFFKSNVDGTDPALHFHDTTKEELGRFGTPDEFLWVSYIPRVLFPDWLNQCSRLEASFVSDWPSITVEKCGHKFFHMQSKEKLELLVYRCIFAYETQHVTHQPAAHFDDKIGTITTSISNEGMQNEIPRISFDRGESKGTKNQDNPRKLQDFEPFVVCTSCFPPNEILDWFSYQSDEPTMTITPPPNLHDDLIWMGLVLCVYFSVQEHSTNIDTDMDSQTHYLLFCQSEGIEPSLTHFLTRKDLKLLRLGRFIWMSYIPRQWFSNWLNHSSHIEASIVAVFPGLTMQKWGFRFLFQNDEMEWKETIRRCEASFSEETIKPILEKQEKPNRISSFEEDSHFERRRGSPNPKPKGKGKAIIE